MAELRSVTLICVLVAAQTVIVQHLFEEKVRLKKIVMTINHIGNIVGNIRATLTKHNVEPLHGSVGHIMTMIVGQNFLTDGMASPSETAILDFGSDYVQMEEDSLLYLRGVSNIAGITGHVYVTLHYEEG